MPTVTETPIRGFAHCSDPLCSGNSQEPVDLLRIDTAYSYVDSGGDLPGTEKSFIHLRFVDEADAQCSVCAGSREASDQTRPSYPTSQWSADGLLDLLRQGKVKKPGEPLVPASDDKVSDLERQLVEQRALMAQQSAELAEMKGLMIQSARRGPGRPRKEEVTTDGA